VRRQRRQRPSTNDAPGLHHGLMGTCGTGSTDVGDECHAGQGVGYPAVGDAVTRFVTAIQNWTTWRATKQRVWLGRNPIAYEAYGEDREGVHDTCRYRTIAANLRPFPVDGLPSRAWCGRLPAGASDTAAGSP